MLNDSATPVGTDRPRRVPLVSRGSGDFGDGLSAAFELIATPGLFGLGGYFLDRRLGTTPLCTIVLTLAVLSYMVWKFWYLYTQDVEAEAVKLREHNRQQAEVETGLTRRERGRLHS